MEDSPVTKLISTVFSFYVMTVMFAGTYYNWQYAKDHGFVQWIFLGEIVPTAKSLIWPYYAFELNQPSSVTKGSVTTPSSVALATSRALTPAEQEDHNREAISRFNAVTRMRTEEIRFNLQYDSYPEGQTPQAALDKMKSYQDNMLAAGQGIDIEVLNSAFPELGNRFRDEFLKGLSLLINFENIGIAARKSGNPAPITPEMAVQAGGGEELLREWQGWYDSHYGDMLVALKKKMGAG
jgi:hypothetical protein